MLNFRVTSLFWLFAYAFSISGFGYYVYTSYYKLNHSPEIIKSTREVDPENFPFPAVTICPNIFARDKLSNIQKIQQSYWQDKSLNMSEEECAILTANLHWCQPEYLYFVKRYCKLYKYDDVNVADIIRKTAHRVDEWSFYDILTNQGICYSFNLLDPKMIYSKETHEDLKRTSINSSDADPIWTPEMGLKNSTFLIKAIGGKRERFFLPLYMNDEENFCWRKKFRIYIHKSNEIITQYHEKFYVNFDDSFSIYVTVKSLRTDPALRNFPIDVRKCYFEGERKLKFFKTYTKTSCEWECFANLTLKTCGCVKFSMPRDQNTKVCNVTNVLECIFKKLIKKPCNCYAPCNDVEYITTTESYPNNRDTVSKKYLNTSSFAAVMVRIQVLMETVEEVENLLSYKIQNFIADLGGFLGLFLGFSLLTIMESLHTMVVTFCSKFKPSKQTAPEGLIQNFEDITKTKNDLLQLKSDFDQQRSENKKSLKEILTRLDELAQKIDTKISKNNQGDEELINETFLHINENNQ